MNLLLALRFTKAILIRERTIHRYYKDILDRISEAPVWFDENAVPRFCKFLPSETAYIHAQEAALVLIKCQGCPREFEVAFTEWNLRHELWDDSNKKIKNISDLIADGSIHYGDPPNIGCCAAGHVMNSVAIRVLEYWYKPVVRGEGVEAGVVKGVEALDFRRDPKFEIDILTWLPDDKESKSKTLDLGGVTYKVVASKEAKD